MKKYCREKKGITLIALVITIIVLLILAGITLVTLSGQNGILTKTSEAKKGTDIANIKEQIQIKIMEEQLLKNNYNRRYFKRNIIQIWNYKL